jgi:flagellar basal-body rod protein FlgC
VTFANRLDRAMGVETVQVSRIGTAPGEFPTRYEPSHPAADERGYVRMPNVDALIEVMDMREAQRSYSANLSVLETTRGMLTRAIEALR